MLQVSQLFLYPIKSMGGIALTSATVGSRGFEHDRRWLLIDENNRFLSQRQLPQMALFAVSIHSEVLDVHYRPADAHLLLPFQPEHPERITVHIWNDTCAAQVVSEKANRWFSEILGTSCRLVYMPDTSQRKVEHLYARRDELIGFSDAFPFLVVSQASLDELNSRLATPIPMNRFRPNIVISGSEPFDEDCFSHLNMGGMDFFGVKPCARCLVTTTNQETGERGAEPLRTLSTYRSKKNKVYFGQYMVHEGSGRLQVGDAVTIKKFEEVLLPG